MITIEAVCLHHPGLEPAELERWIGERWVRPAGTPGEWRFRPVDVARVRLIRELRVELAVGEDTLPLVLSLLDQLYAERRRLRRLREVLERDWPAERRDALLAALVPDAAGDDR